MDAGLKSRFCCSSGLPTRPAKFTSAALASDIGAPLADCTCALQKMFSFMKMASSRRA
jgi:hypothetical protein